MDNITSATSVPDTQVTQTIMVGVDHLGFMLTGTFQPQTAEHLRPKMVEWMDKNHDLNWYMVMDVPKEEGVSRYHAGYDPLFVRGVCHFSGETTDCVVFELAPNYTLTFEMEGV